MLCFGYQRLRGYPLSLPQLQGFLPLFSAACLRNDLNHQLSRNFVDMASMARTSASHLDSIRTRNYKLTAWWNHIKTFLFILCSCLWRSPQYILLTIFPENMIRRPQSGPRLIDEAISHKQLSWVPIQRSSGAIDFAPGVLRKCQVFGWGGGASLSTMQTDCEDQTWIRGLQTKDSKMNKH